MESSQWLGIPYSLPETNQPGLNQSAPGGTSVPAITNVSESAWDTVKSWGHDVVSEVSTWDDVAGEWVHSAYDGTVAGIKGAVKDAVEIVATPIDAGLNRVVLYGGAIVLILAVGLYIAGKGGSKVSVGV